MTKLCTGKEGQWTDERPKLMAQQSHCQKFSARSRDKQIASHQFLRTMLPLPFFLVSERRKRRNTDKTDQPQTTRQPVLQAQPRVSGTRNAMARFRQI